MTELILTYVPESEHLTHAEALMLANERDEQAADAFVQSMLDNEKLSNDDWVYLGGAGSAAPPVKRPVLVTQMIEDEKEFRQSPTWNHWVEGQL